MQNRLNRIIRAAKGGSQGTQKVSFLPNKSHTATRDEWRRTTWLRTTIHAFRYVLERDHEINLLPLTCDKVVILNGILHRKFA